MKFPTAKAAIAASLLSLAVQPAFALKTPTELGCYKSVQPLKDLGKWLYQTEGYCQEQCVKQKKPVFALFKGSNCFCGDKIPAKSQKTDSKLCNLPCNGFGEHKCGGKTAYAVWITGEVDEEDIDIYDGPITQTSPGSTTTTGPDTTVITKAGETIVITAGASEEKSSGPNTAGIAAGVVVGVVALGAIIGGVFFFLKYKKRKASEEEYRRHAAISSFVAGGKPYSQSSADSRLDPSLMSQRRQSNGSIADDQDFSRRILKVCRI
ncbi:hypothetical protein AJ80_05351 [Polytolypa hystricis UAMH7299]|uniref:WSC domain-containing protein n=1 Tax=Polytolypa hystricis (strain UAMH7299) TaxID=1447883 RepID=A0A2B7Y436_POLH7|nr:hypothetical protein AJ80_05351 [Polytolypa hystricis UAMH7299]